ncbi:MAG: electron transfer flavoprotein subunit alpha/FixB family protein [Cytophagales bacterium]|nr:electron transfer flavoprotein subunit alpha/FixB family protein [Cytophagales bacterium]
MSIICYVECAGSTIKKSSLECASFASQVASKLGVRAYAIVIANTDNAQLEMLGNYGIAEVLHIDDAQMLPMARASAIYDASKSINANIVIFPKSVSVDGFASRLAVKMKANMVSNVCELPITDGTFTVKRSLYTGKAFAITELKSENKVLVVKKNAVQPIVTQDKASVKKISFQPQETDTALKVTEVVKSSGDLLLTEAEIVVSGGRGMKGPENWHLIENLAKALGAATGCSKPVSDMDWRPHHEHVGQTGVKVSPNIYIAVGISGAIQHLAGVNTSKCIVVINKDPEAPFFKAADYGIVGDAFEILPKLTDAAKKILT